MRSRDEVLQERSLEDAPIHYDSAAASAWCSGYDTAIDRLRELEAQQAASEPVAWAAEVIAHHLSYTNGWRVSDERYAENCTQAAMDILSRLSPHPSAAAVTVTEAMVNAAARRGRDYGFNAYCDNAQEYWAAMESVLTAALTAASERREEGASE